MGSWCDCRRAAAVPRSRGFAEERMCGQGPVVLLPLRQEGQAIVVPQLARREAVAVCELVLQEEDTVACVLWLSCYRQRATARALVQTRWYRIIVHARGRWYKMFPCYYSCQRARVQNATVLSLPESAGTKCYHVIHTRERGYKMLPCHPRMRALVQIVITISTPESAGTGLPTHRRLWLTSA